MVGVGFNFKQCLFLAEFQNLLIFLYFLTILSVYTDQF